MNGKHVCLAVMLCQFCHLTLKGSVNTNLIVWVEYVVHMEEHLKMNVILLLPFIPQSFKRLASS